ncbi:YbaB/EbfC family DNA-binding protein [Pseudonocardia sp. ICBG1122]|nr:YbaB/EbfC family DNA-binding protein [Pseudonocardia pini]
MSDRYALGFGDRAIDEALARLDRERRKIDELSRVWNEETTTVHSRDRSFSLTLDGRGDLAGVAFNGNRYRTLAPAELAQMLVDTMRTGRVEALERMAEVMHADDRPNLDIVGMATGKVDPNTILEELIGPMLDSIGMGDRVRRDDRG